jgi:hypothetical protein
VAISFSNNILHHGVEEGVVVVVVVVSMCVTYRLKKYSFPCSYEFFLASPRRLKHLEE